MNLIYQCFIQTGKNDGHNGGKYSDGRLVLKSKETVSEYAKSIGCDYIFEDKPDLPESKVYKGVFMKFLWCLALCEEKYDEYEWIMYIDSDIVMKSPDDIPNIFNEIDKSKDFHAVNEPNGYAKYYNNIFIKTRYSMDFIKDHAYIYDFYHKIHEYMNTGVWIANRKCRKLFRENWVNMLNNRKSIDQTNAWPHKNFGTEDMPLINGMVHNLGISYSFLDCKWNAIADVLKPEFLKKEAYCIHYGGVYSKIIFDNPEELLGRGNLANLYYKNFAHLKK